MIRFANTTSRNARRLQANSVKSPDSLFAEQCDRTGHKSILRRRFRSNGNSQAKQQHEMGNNGGNMRPAHASAERAPAFLQKLKVQPSIANSPAHATKAPNLTTRNRRQYDSSKLEDLIRQGPASRGVAHPGHSTQHTSKSATQSNLQGSLKKAGVTPNLVDFFQKRLAEASRATEESVPKVSTSRLSNSRDPIRSPRSLQRGPPIPRAQKPIRKPQPFNQDGLMAAKSEAKTALMGVSKSRTNPSTSLGGSINEHFNTSLSSVNIPTSEENKKKTESISPISQFIREIKKKNEQQKKEGAVKEPKEEPALPSWRKSAQLAQEKLSLDPLFLATHRNFSEPVEPKPDPYQLHFAKREEETPKNKHVETKPKIIVLPSHEVTVKQLSPLLGVKVSKVMKTLEGLGEIPVNDDAYTIDVDVVEMIAMELNIKVERSKRRQKTEVNDHKQLMERRKNVEDGLEDTPAAETAKKTYGQLARRPPVVCIMGHVDHGKTTLMDSLRRLARGETGKKMSKKSKKKSGKKVKAKKGNDDVAGTEAGGITQVVSAFQVPLGEQKDSLTFLDTPGHAAFSSMRQSGSHAADVIVLVIAADDGVSPQTIEILNYYKSIVKDSEGGITMVVAMNKIDKPGIDVSESQTRIENELIEHGIIPEGVTTDSEYGSPVQFFPISAKTGDGLDDLIEGLALQSEIMDLRADDTARAEGIVMDARVEQGLGVVVDCIVRWGSIKPGDVVVSGTDTGKVRILKDVDNKSIKTGTPSQPVRIVGFKTPPKAGDPVVCVANEKIADDLISRRLLIQNRQRSQNEQSGDSNLNFSQIIITGRESMTTAGTERKLEKYDLDLEDTGPIRIPVVVKASADGSVAAVRDSLLMLGTESSFDLNIDIVAEGVGPLTRTDIEMAKSSNAAVFCFDVKNNDKTVLAMAEAEEVPIHEYDIIYALLDNAKDLFTEYLPPVPVETVHGKAAVQAVFSISGGKETVAGLKVLDGYLYKSSVEVDGKATPVHFRVKRNGETVSPEGKGLTSTSLRKFKEDVESARQGEECGLSLSGISEYEEGDVIECFSVKMKKSFA